MTPRALMITGATMGLFGAAVAVVRSDVGQFAVFLFAAGAVFGKGYGVYEERTRGAVRRRAGEDDVRGMQIALEKAWEGNRERQAEIERLRLALQDVVNPLANLRRYAEEQNSTLVSGAYSIANNLNFVQQIAKAALDARNTIGGDE